MLYQGENLTMCYLNVARDFCLFPVLTSGQLSRSGCKTIFKNVYSNVLSTETYVCVYICDVQCVCVCSTYKPNIFSFLFFFRKVKMSFIVNSAETKLTLEVLVFCRPIFSQMKSKIHMMSHKIEWKSQWRITGKKKKKSDKILRSIQCHLEMRCVTPLFLISLNNKSLLLVLTILSQSSFSDCLRRGEQASEGSAVLHSAKCDQT